MGRAISAIAERTAELGRVLGVVGEAVGLVIEHLDHEAVTKTGKPQDRRGGYFCWAVNMSGAPLIVHAQIGVVRAGKIDKYRAFSLEKATRLAGRPGDVSSWQSRDEMHDQYGGAIYIEGAIFSFSGLPEHGDEAAMLLAARKLKLLTAEQALAIAQISSNELYRNITSWLHGRNAWNDGSWTVPAESTPEYRVPPSTGT